MTAKSTIARLRAEATRYYSDRTAREAMPCAECGQADGCKHFPKKQSA